MSIFKKFTAVALSAALFAAPLPEINSASAASGIYVKYRTADEIAEYMRNHPFNYNASEFDALPSYTQTPYEPGKLSDATLENALNALNTVRFIAGLDEVSLSDNYNDLAQAGTLVNAVNDELTHSPSQPSGMSDELYEKCLEGSSSSNIGWEYGSLAENIIYGWMSDADSSNISRVGHRRWCLNPSMKQTGFGNTGKYYAMYAFDGVWNETEYYGVSWPAQIMPAELFGNNDPWSISMGYQVDPSNVNVNLVRKNDGKRWSFSQTAADGYFNVENNNYGKKGCIIFRPDNISYSAGDSFEVTITGLDETISYTVEFCDINADEPAITKTSLEELINFILKKEYNIEKVSDFNDDGNIDVFDAVVARRSLTS